MELAPLFTIGKPSDPERPSPFGLLDRDSQGRFFTISDNHQVLVYDARGNYMTALGRKGRGPGEFDVPDLQLAHITDVVIGPADSVFVFVPPTVTVFSPALRYVRATVASSYWQLMASIYPFGSGNWLFSATVREPAHAGMSAHILTASGELATSIGPVDAVVPGASARPRRLMLSPDQQTIWFYNSYYYYAFEAWSRDNRFLRRLDFSNVPWAPEPTFRTEQTARGPRRTATSAGAVELTGVDTAGRLWVFGHAPRPDTTMYLDIVDGKSGSVNSSQKVRSAVFLLRDGMLAWSKSEDVDGFISINVYSYRMIAR